MKRSSTGPVQAPFQVAFRSYRMVEYPEDLRGRATGFSGPHCVDEPIEGRLVIGLGTVPEDLPSTGVEGSEIGDDLPPRVLGLHPDRMARGGGSGGSSASWGLDAGLLIRREDILVGAERLAFPKAVVEVDYRLDERAEGRVPRDLPSAEAPRSEDIGPEISGDGRAAGSVGHLVTDLPSDVGIGEAAERKPPGERAARSAQTGLMTHCGH